MSIADKITALNTIRSDIRTALYNKGVSGAMSMDFSDFASAISNVTTGVPSTLPVPISQSSYYYLSDGTKYDLNTGVPIGRSASELEAVMIYANSTRPVIIPDYYFYGCSNLKSVGIYGTNITLSGIHCFSGNECVVMDDGDYSHFHSDPSWNEVPLYSSKGSHIPTRVEPVIGNQIAVGDLIENYAEHYLLMCISPTTITGNENIGEYYEFVGLL